MTIEVLVQREQEKRKQEHDREVRQATPNVGLKMTAEAVGAGIVERELNDPTLRYGVLDPACLKEDGGPSIAERINKELIAARLRPFHAADNSRVPHRGSMGAWDQLRSRGTRRKLVPNEGEGCSYQCGSD